MRETRLLACKARLLSQIVLSQSPLVLQLQRTLNSSQSPQDIQAATRLLQAHKGVNLFVYEFKKNGVRQAFSVPFPSLKFAPPKFEIGRRKSTDEAAPNVGRVAFTITSATRERLRELGYSTEAVRQMKPAAALALVDSSTRPDEASPVLESKIDARIEEKGPRKETPYNMSAAIRDLRQDLKMKKWADSRRGGGGVSSTVAEKFGTDDEPKRSKAVAVVASDEHKTKV